MRIAIFGNTNNLPLALALALRRLGHDVDLIVNRPQLLHRPESCNPAWARAYPPWIHDVSDVPDQRQFCEPETLGFALDVLRRADAAILNDIGPSLSGYLDTRPYIVHLTGSDLDYYARPESIEVRTRTWSPGYRRSREARDHVRRWRAGVERQRRGIAGATAVAYMPRGAVREGDALLDQLGVTDARRITLYFIDRPQTAFRPPSARDTMIIFCGARIAWVKPGVPGRGPLDFKGTDRLLRGFALLRHREGIAAELRLVEKGDDVAATKRLAADLGVDEAVVWLPEMDRVAFRAQLEDADVVVDHFDSSFIGMAGLEAMAVGRPLVAKAANAYWRSRLGVEPPILHAEHPEEICAQLGRLATSRHLRIEIGLAAREFVLQHWTAEVAARECLAWLTNGRGSRAAG